MTSKDQMKVPDYSTAAIALFDPKRLALAREARGLLKSELAEYVGTTKVTIGNYEAGKKRPSPGMIRQLALALQVPISFFADLSGRSPEQPTAYFRRLRSTTVRTRLQAKAAAAFAHELVTALEQRVKLPELTVPTLRLDNQASTEDIEQAAQQTRVTLEAEKGPLGMLIRRIERLGVVVIRLPVESTGIDAFSVPYMDHPVMVLGSDTDAFDRYRWSAAHELGHLVIHGQLEAEPNKQQEAQADLFAQALLMPTKDIRFTLPRHVDWTALLSLKRDWGVPIAALIEKAYRLSMLSDSQRTNAYKVMSRRGWRKKEPVDLGPTEPPSLLALAVSTVMEVDQIGLDKVAELARLSIKDIEKLLERATDNRPVINLFLDKEPSEGPSHGKLDRQLG
jgi:Zn-dependent peptidase ImmA (M78 family)/transcriptional regulator with XRE-family HTH domain